MAVDKSISVTSETTPVTIEKQSDNVLKKISDKTFHTDLSRSPEMERSMSTTLDMEYTGAELLEQITKSASLDPITSFGAELNLINTNREKEKAKEKSAAATANPIFNTKSKETDNKDKSEVTEIEKMKLPILKKTPNKETFVGKNKDNNHKENTTTSKVVSDALVSSSSASDFKLIQRSSMELYLNANYVDRPLIPNTEMVLINSTEPMSAAPVIGQDDDRWSTDSEHSTIFITKSSRALKREPKKDALKEISSVKLYLPKKFVMQLEQNWFFNIRKECKVTIELSSYKNDKKSVAVTVIGLPRNISNAVGRIAEAKLRILHNNTPDFNSHTCRMYMIESKKTCKMLQTTQEQFLQFTSNKYQCYITVGSEEEPIGDEDVIALSGNAISIKEVVHEIIRKIEYGIQRESKIKATKSKDKKTGTARSKKSKSRPTSKSSNKAKTETAVEPEINEPKTVKESNNVKTFKVPDIPDTTFIGRLNDTMFSDSLLFLNEPSVRQELLGYDSINVIYYKISRKTSTLEVYGGFDLKYRSLFGKNVLRNYEVHYDVFIDMSTSNNNTQQKFTLIASVPNAFKVLGKLNDRINSHK